MSAAARDDARDDARAPGATSGRTPTGACTGDESPRACAGDQSAREPAPGPAPAAGASPWREFAARRDGMIHAMDGGLWLHHHVWKGTPMAHLVSTDRDALLAYGRSVGLPAHRLQDKPLKDPRTGERRPAWHWDLVGPYLPPRTR